MHVVDDTRRHCASCEKTLVDFSQMSDDEIASFLQYNNKKLCGRFSSTQLNRGMLQIPAPKFRPAWRMWLLFPLTLIGKILHAQQDTVPAVDSMNAVTQIDSIAPEVQIDSLVVNDTVAPADSALVQQDTVIDNTSLAVCKPELMPFDWIPYPAISAPVEIYAPPTTGYMVILTGDICVRPGEEFSKSLGDVALLDPPDDTTPDGTRITRPTGDYSSNDPGEKSKDGKAPPLQPKTPWYEAILPKAVRVRRK